MQHHFCIAYDNISLARSAKYKIIYAMSKTHKRLKYVPILREQGEKIFANFRHYVPFTINHFLLQQGKKTKCNFSGISICAFYKAINKQTNRQL